MISSHCKSTFGYMIGPNSWLILYWYRPVECGLRFRYPVFVPVHSSCRSGVSHSSERSAEEGSFEALMNVMLMLTKATVLSVWTVLGKYALHSFCDGRWILGLLCAFRMRLHISSARSILSLDRTDRSSPLHSLTI